MLVSFALGYQLIGKVGEHDYIDAKKLLLKVEQ
jgi:hypothetical protein